MKPNLQEGFDEADRGKDVRGRPNSGKQYTLNVRPIRDAHKDNRR
jgi:hypothetical protein